MNEDHTRRLALSPESRPSAFRKHRALSHGQIEAFIKRLRLSANNWEGYVARHRVDGDFALTDRDMRVELQSILKELDCQ